MIIAYEKAAIADGIKANIRKDRRRKTTLRALSLFKTTKGVVVELTRGVSGRGRGRVQSDAMMEMYDKLTDGKHSL